MTPDHNKAATKAAETLVKYGVCTAPVSPLQILEKMDNVIVVSFEELGENIAPTFGRCRDAVTSIHIRDDRSVYVVAYNGLLPFNLLQRALARELGHIVLGHKDRGPDNEIEAQHFAMHLLCPRPLVHAIQAISMRFTEDLLGNLTGIYQQPLVYIRKVPGADVPEGLNRFVRNQFMPFIMNFFDYYRQIVPQDGSAIADFGTYMDNYKE